MVSPVELTKLGVTARLRKLGYLKYAVMLGLLFLVISAFEIFRYVKYRECFGPELISIYTADIKLHELEKRIREEKNPPDYVFDLSEAYLSKDFETTKSNCTTSYDLFRWFVWLKPTTAAYAQINTPPPLDVDNNTIRVMGIVVIFACIVVFFFISAGALLFSTNPKVVAFAMDSLKTLLGFFIGVAMTFMGVRP